MSKIVLKMSGVIIVGETMRYTRYGKNITIKITKALGGNEYECTEVKEKRSHIQNKINAWKKSKYK